MCSHLNIGTEVSDEFIVTSVGVSRDWSAAVNCWHKNEARCSDNSRLNFAYPIYTLYFSLNASLVIRNEW